MGWTKRWNPSMKYPTWISSTGVPSYFQTTCGWLWVASNAMWINCAYLSITYPDSKIYAANMGPTWVMSAPGGPHVGPLYLLCRWKTSCHQNCIQVPTPNFTLICKISFESHHHNLRKKSGWLQKLMEIVTWKLLWSETSGNCIFLSQSA